MNSIIYVCMAFEVYLILLGLKAAVKFSSFFFVCGAGGGGGGGL